MNFKVVVYVPTADADEVREAIGQAGGGKLGNYSYCSFSVSGIGRFKPEQGANPAIGNVGEYESVEEDRIEVTCSEAVLDSVIAAIRKVHPYEEIAMDVYKLEN